MRRLHIIFLIISLILCHGCNNEVDIHGNGDAIPIVYCLLNPMEHQQYVRIGKTFTIFEDINNSSVPGDSLIWPVDAMVYIEKWENDNPVETILFEYSPEIEKDSGYFATDGLMAYTADFMPLVGEEYHLYVYFPELDKIVSGKTQVIAIPELIDPAIVPGRTVSFDTISPYNIRWRAGNNAGLYQGVFKMRYTESDNVDFSLKSCSFPTPLYYKLSPADIYEEKINGLNFLQSVAEQIQAVPGITRELINFEFFFYSSGPELAILVGSDIGVSTPFTIIRNSSNVDGGRGVFSSLTVQRFPNLEPARITHDFLATSTITGHLGFNND